MRIQANGKIYRQTEPPRNKRVSGRYEFFYPFPNGKQWHNVLNYQIREQLDKLMETMA